MTARKIGGCFQVTQDTLMDAGALPDTRPRPVTPRRRARVRWWCQTHLAVSALRVRLADWLDPDPKDWHA